MKQIIEETAKECGVNPDVVQDVIDSFYHYIRRKMSAKKFMELDSFAGVKTHFSLMGFGKLLVSNKLKRKHEERKRRKSEDSLHLRPDNNNNEHP